MINKFTEESLNLWLSALIDGEGCLLIRFDKQRTSKNPSVKIEISISNTNKEILDVAKDIVGHGSICEKRVDPKGNRKKHWVYRIPTGGVREILPKLYLIVKREQKKVLLEALSLIGKTPIGGNRKRDKESEEKLKNLKSKLHILNKRGI